MKCAFLYSSFVSSTQRCFFGFAAKHLWWTKSSFKQNRCTQPTASERGLQIEGKYSETHKRSQQLLSRATIAIKSCWNPSFGPNLTSSEQKKLGSVHSWASTCTGTAAFWINLLGSLRCLHKLPREAREPESLLLWNLTKLPGTNEQTILSLVPTSSPVLPEIGSLLRKQ